MIKTLDERMWPTEKIAINRTSFHKAYYRYPNYYDDVGIQYLNRYYGDIEELLDEYELEDSYGLNPEQIRYHQDKIQNNPEKYLLIDGIWQEDDYLILLSFLNSDWTYDQLLKKLVKDCYQGSVDGWMENIWNIPNIDIEPCKVIDRWHRYLHVEINRMMEEFLHGNRVDFKWC